MRIASIIIALALGAGCTPTYIAGEAKQQCRRLTFWGERLVCMENFECQGTACTSRGGPLLMLEPREVKGALGTTVGTLEQVGLIESNATGTPVVSDDHLVVPNAHELAVFSTEFMSVARLSFDDKLLDQVGAGTGRTVYVTTSDGSGHLFRIEWSPEGMRTDAKIAIGFDIPMDVTPRLFGTGLVLVRADSWAFLPTPEATSIVSRGSLSASTSALFDATHFVSVSEGGYILEAPLDATKQFLEAAQQGQHAFVASAPYIASSQGDETTVSKLVGSTLVPLATFPHRSAVLAFEFPRLASFDPVSGLTRVEIVADPEPSAGL